MFVLITPLIGGSVNSTQIAAYVVSGIGFLAGGVIFKERLSVSGLNTAATLWCTAAVGALVGYGFLIEAAIRVAAVLAANIVLRPLALVDIEVDAIGAKEEADNGRPLALIVAGTSANYTYHIVSASEPNGFTVRRCRCWSAVPNH